MLWNDSEGDGNGKNKCEEDEVTAFEDGHSTMKTKKSDTDMYRQIECHTCNIFINCKIYIFFFLQKFYQGVVWDLDICIFSWQTCFIFVVVLD